MSFNVSGISVLGRQVLTPVLTIDNRIFLELTYLGVDQYKRFGHVVIECRRAGRPLVQLYAEPLWIRGRCFNGLSYPGGIDLRQLVVYWLYADIPWTAFNN